MKKNLIKFSSIMIGTAKPQELSEFYEKVLGRAADIIEEGTWHGWLIGEELYLSIGEHSEVKGKSKEPHRLIINFETSDINEDFARIKALGATVIKEPYEMGGVWIATFEDPDGNYFQLMTSWKK